LLDLPLEQLKVDSAESVVVAAKISDSVDECPYMGYYLAAQSSISCLVLQAPAVMSSTLHDESQAEPSQGVPSLPGVRDISGTWQALPWLSNSSGRNYIPTSPGEGFGGAFGPGAPFGPGGLFDIQEPSFNNYPRVPGAHGVVRDNGLVRMAAPLQCSQQGCEAAVEMMLNYSAVNLHKCLLTVNISQTDFEDAGHFEGLSYIKVNGQPLLSNSTPGRNPCKESTSGSPLGWAQRQHQVIDRHDITDLAAHGVVTIQGRISNLVDECPFNQYLFVALVVVDCNISAIRLQAEE